jgi:hypothetical protein
LRRNRTVGRPPSGALTVSGRTQPSSSRPCPDRERPGLAPQQRAHVREIADCLDEALRLQSRVMDLTEQVYEAAGMSPGDRTLRGKVTGLFFGLQAQLEELNRLAQDDA